MEESVLWSKSKMWLSEVSVGWSGVVERISGRSPSEDEVVDDEGEGDEVTERSEEEETEEEEEEDEGEDEGGVCDRRI